MSIALLLRRQQFQGQKFVATPRTEMKEFSGMMLLVGMGFVAVLESQV